MASLLVLWIHVLSAIFWVGGMLFLTVVLAPVLRSESGKPETYVFFKKVATRFRNGVWVAILFLVLTGPLLLSNQVSFEIPFQQWPVVVLIKLVLVFVLIVFAGLHDLVLGPRAGALKKKPQADLTASERSLLNLSPWFARGILVLGVAVVMTGIAISRW